MVRFHKKIDFVNAITQKSTQPLYEFEIIMLFIDKLSKVVSNADQRTQILGYKKACKYGTDPSNTPFSLTEIHIELNDVEVNMLCKICVLPNHTAIN